jgi:hypothetical protein
MHLAKWRNRRDYRVERTDRKISRFVIADTLKHSAKADGDELTKTIVKFLPGVFHSQRPLARAVMKQYDGTVTRTIYHNNTNDYCALINTRISKKGPATSK